METFNQGAQIILDSLRKRKSVRVYEDRPVAQTVKAALIQAAIEAPTAGNQMLYTILDITDQSIKDRLAVTCDHQPFIATAPLVFVFLADCRRWLDAYRAAGLAVREPGAGDLLLAIQDAVIAAQNMVVAGEALGLGSCYIGDVLEQAEVHRELLGLDDYTLPIAMLVMGYPTEQQRQREKPTRFEARFIVQENQYRRLSEAEHREMFMARSPEIDFEGYLERFAARKYMSDFSLEMTRSSGVLLKPFLKQTPIE